MIQLSPDQTFALTSIRSWFFNQHEKRIENKELDRHYLTFGGFAGTGKTTLISILLNELEINEDLDGRFRHIHVMALTGRAALNIKKAMDENGVELERLHYSTIHRYLYKPIINSKGIVTGWEKDPERRPDDIALIIVDESSMLTKEIFDDLMSLGVPILFVGDHGQLPPVSGNFNLMEKPDLRLEKIHRQALDSPIIQLSMRARQGLAIAQKDYSDTVRKVSTVEAVEHLVKDGDDFAFIVGTNKARVKLNRSALRYMNYDQYEPKIGVRVICLKNNYSVSPPIFNGQLGAIRAIERTGIDWNVSIAMEGNGTLDGVINGDVFNDPMPKVNDPMYHRGLALFDFGYALTCHKAQGSQFQRVFVFGSGFGTRDMRNRWMYTAITRAKEELYICGDKV